MLGKPLVLVGSMRRKVPHFSAGDIPLREHGVMGRWLRVKHKEKYLKTEGSYLR